MSINHIAMLAEVLLVLGGHPSSLIGPEGVSPALAELLHPGEVASLDILAALAANYAAIRTWTLETQAAARAAVLQPERSSKGKERDDGPGQYVAVLAGAIREVLVDYDQLLVRTEAAVLSQDAGVVQPSASGGYVPLSLLLATFDEWQAPMAALASLVERVQERRYAPGELMQHLAQCAETGHPGLRKAFTSLLLALWRLFLAQLVIFLLDGIAPEDSTPSAPAVGLDAGADPPHRLYRLDDSLIPSSVKQSTRESILYVGRVAATLKREGRSLPRSLTDQARQDVLASTFDGLDESIQRVRADIGEWLWTHILTGPQVADAIDTFAKYFLTREADFALNVIREISRLREERLVLANPTSSSSVLRAHDLDLALLRASVGTTAEADRALETLTWCIPSGPIRPHTRPAPDDGSIRNLFSPALLGTPIVLTASVSWPLDLFMTAPAVAAYADMHAYLYAIRDAHTRVLECWSSLSGAQRRRRVYTGVDEGGAGEERAARTALARAAWGTVRAMLFFLDQLLSHFMTDIIGVQHKRLLEQLADAAPRPSGRPASARSSSPGRGAAYLDFLTLRQMHARHVAFLREGLLIAERESATLIRDILDTCKRFSGLVERWGGDVLPELLMDDEEPGQLIAKRAAAVEEVNVTLHDQISDFFRMLLDSQAPAAPPSDGSASASATSASRAGSRTMLSRARMTQMIGSRSRLAADGDELMGRHVEQLLLRLDFNGVLTTWQDGRVRENVLPPRLDDLTIRE